MRPTDGWELPYRDACKTSYGFSFALFPVIGSHEDSLLWFQGDMTMDECSNVPSYHYFMSDKILTHIYTLADSYAGRVISSEVCESCSLKDHKVMDCVLCVFSVSLTMQWRLLISHSQIIMVWKWHWKIFAAQTASSRNFNITVLNPQVIHHLPYSQALKGSV